MESGAAEGGVIFAITCSMLWKQRNSFVFQQQIGSVEHIVNAVICMAANICEIYKKQGRISATCKDQVKWSPPSPGWTKINSDGAASREEDWAAAAGVLCNSDGEWVAGYQRFVGSGSALDSKL